MDTQKIIANAPHWKKVAAALHKIRTPAHVGSAITTALFILAYLLGYDIVAMWEQKEPYTFYTFGFALCLVAASQFEWLVEPIVDSLGFVVASWGSSKRLAGIVILVALPLIIITSATSFVGIKTSVGGDSEAIAIKEVIDAKVKLKEKSTNTNLNNKELAILEDNRANQRETLEANIRAELGRKLAANEGLEWGTRQAENKKLQAAAETKIAQKLADFDTETSMKSLAILSKQKVENAVLQSQDNQLIEKLEKAKMTGVNRLGIMSNFLGLASVFCVLLSVLASIGLHTICYILKCDIKDCLPQPKKP